MKLPTNKKHLRNIVIALLLLITAVVIIILLNRPQKDNYGNYIVEDDYIVKEESYQSNSEQVDYNFPISITENGKKYKLLDASSEVNQQGFTKPYIHNVTEEAKSESEINAPEEITVNFNGEELTVYLVDKQIESILENREPVKATGFTDFDLSIGYPDVPSTKVIDYYDEVTKTTHKVTLSLDEVVTKTTPRWVNDVKIPLTFNVYGADYYVLYDTQIPHNEDAPKLQGKEDLILQMVGLNSEFYRIESFAWKGGEYEQEGQKKRDAVAYGSRFVGDYRANYSNSNVILSGSQKLKVNLTYHSKENLVGDEIFNIQVKGIYAPSNSLLSYTLGAFLLLLFAVIVLYVIATQKERKEEKNNV